MNKQQLKAIAHHTNKLQILLHKYLNLNNANIKAEIEQQIYSTIENFKLKEIQSHD